MSDINWKGGAVCYANGTQYHAKDGIDGILFDAFMLQKSFDEVLTFGDFNLNEIRVGDYIEKSELDTEEKYNEAVEVFWLFGFEEYTDITVEIDAYSNHAHTLFLIDFDGEILGSNEIDKDAKRKLTYNQLMRIGELKRLMDEKGATTFNVEPVKPMTAICDNDLEKYKESVRAMETLGYKWCDENKAWYQEIKEWVI